MRRGNRFAWAMMVLAFACATALGQQGGNGGQGGGGQGGGGQGGTGGQGGGGQGGGGQGGMTSGTPLIELERAPIITAPGSTTGGGAAAGTGGADASNIFGRTYGNPYYQGMPANAKSSAPGGFGSPLYNTTGGAGGAGGRGGAALGGRGLGARGLGGRGLGGAGQDGVLVQQPISISYPAIATFPVTPVATPQLQADITGMIARTRAITNPAGITATVENGIVTLSGTVKDASEARTLASMILLTPGVRSVKNNLSIAKQ